MENQITNEEFQAILTEEARNEAWETWKDYFDGIQLDDDLDDNFDDEDED